MPKIPSYKHLDKVLRKLGFVVVRTKGSHIQYRKGSSLITVSKHSNKEIKILIASYGVSNLFMSSLCHSLKLRRHAVGRSIKEYFSISLLASHNKYRGVRCYIKRTESIQR